MFIYTQIHMLKHNPPGDSTRRCALWRVIIRSWGWRPCEQDWCPYERRPTELPCSFLHVRRQQENGHLWTRKWALTRHSVCQLFYLDFPASRAMRNEQTNGLRHTLSVRNFIYYMCTYNIYSLCWIYRM